MDYTMTVCTEVSSVSCKRLLVYAKRTIRLKEATSPCPQSLCVNHSREDCRAVVDA